MITPTFYKYKRDLEVPEIYERYSVVIMFFVLVVFGYFGVYKLFLLNEQKFSNLLLIKSSEKKLSEKTTELLILKKRSPEIDFYIKKLESAIPMSPDIQSYVVLTDIAARGAGFVQRDFVVSEVDNSSVLLRISFYGPVGYVQDLLRAFENLGRFTYVESFDVKVLESRTIVDIKLRVYYKSV